MLGLSKSHFSNHHNVQVFRKTTKFLATKMEEFDNPSRPVHIPLLDNDNFSQWELSLMAGTLILSNL